MTPTPAAIARAARPEDAPLASPVPRSGVAGANGAQRLTINLPLPPKGLHPNSLTTNGYALSRYRKEARRQAMVTTLATLRQMGTPQIVSGVAFVIPPSFAWTRVRAVATFHGIRRDNDRDNSEAWLKSYRDGIADTVMAFGNDHGWEWEDVRFERGPKGVTIEVWEAAMERARAEAEGTK